MPQAIDKALVTLWSTSGLEASYPLWADEVLEDDSGTPDLPYAVFTIIANTPTCFTSTSDNSDVIVQIKVLAATKDMAATAQEAIDDVMDGATLTLGAGEGDVSLCRPSMRPVPMKENDHCYSYTKRWRVMRREDK